MARRGRRRSVRRGLPLPQPVAVEVLHRRDAARIAHAIDVEHAFEVIELMLDHGGDEVFGLEVPTCCAHVPSQILRPRNTWVDKEAYDDAAAKLAGLFAENFKKFADDASEAIIAAGPRVSAAAGA